MKEVAKLCIVIPCYNEESVIDITLDHLTQKMSQLIEKKIIHEDSKIVMVDDGSSDNTWQDIMEIVKSNRYAEGIKLSRNRGHQNALLGGLMTVKNHFDVTISMDADLQDDINAINQMMEAYYAGAQIIYGVRSSRETDSWFKKHTALGFYRLLRWMGVDSVYNHADYRLMSRVALDSLANFKEVNLFLRGMVPMIGYKTATVEYKRSERVAGESKYPLRKMIEFAIEGITSLSVKPLRLITFTGWFLFILSIIISLYFLVVYFSGNTVPGWTTIVMSIWIIGGVNLLAIGVVGEYIGKIYIETKERPKYIIETYTRDMHEVKL